MTTLPNDGDALEPDSGLDDFPFNKKYNIIYADPPWTYEQKKVRGNVQDQYSTMSNEEVINLPIKDIAAANCALLLWITSPKLAEVFPRIFESWGFTYKTIAFVWVKTNSHQGYKLNNGFYTRSNSEMCFLGIRGKMRVYDHSIFQVHASLQQRHSQKPHVFRERIVRLFGDLPRMELFARHRVQGWDVWGNEITDIPMLTQYLHK